MITSILRSSLKPKGFFSIHPAKNVSRLLQYAQTRSSTCQKRSFFNLSDNLSSRSSYTGYKVVGYTQEQLYDVVSNIDEYHMFIPFCTNSKVLKTKHFDVKKILTAALEVNFVGFSETYVSEVTCERPRYVQAIASSDALFRHLTTLWQFTPHEASPSMHCNLNFSLEFEFASPIHAQLAKTFFGQVSDLMVTAFEKRCEEIYGPPAPDPHTLSDTFGE
ncbi:572_t:CDS:2 [Acaulospora morrowiae]|uniref:572_t:CDS:1 n=1 Tax=Acaulospora morrowiae TaxID=94023 RepID=A0A9N8V8X4_9GLOM|nr:572_t:CDS:2 [Acaulospora morrowiae]